MTEAEIYDRLTAIFRRFFDDPALVLAPATGPADIDGWDSAKTVNIILEIEEAFGFEMSSEEMDALRSVGDFAAVIALRQAEPPSSPSG